MGSRALVKTTAISIGTRLREKRERRDREREKRGEETQIKSFVCRGVHGGVCKGGCFVFVWDDEVVRCVHFVFVL